MSSNILLDSSARFPSRANLCVIFLQEFELLHYSLSSARIFFRPAAVQDEAETKDQEDHKAAAP